MKKWIWLPLLLSGCVSVTPVRLPEGAHGYSLICAPHQHESASCLNKAAELCHGPYQVVSQTPQSTGELEMIVACH
jgi:hypothetical protein